MHCEANDLPTRWAGVPWSEADRADLLSNLRRWGMTWRWGAPCRVCHWPYADYHLCPGAEVPPGPTDE